MPKCPTCHLEQAPAKDIASVLADALIAIRNVERLGVHGRQRRELNRAYLIIGGLAKLFDAEAQRQGQD